MKETNGNVLIVLDFDGTVKLLPHEGNSTWSRMDNALLDQEALRRIQFNRRYFVNRKATVGLSDEAQEIWFEMSLQAWTEGGLNRQIIAETFTNNHQHTRPGFVEFIRWLKKPRNGTTVHVAINSYGFVPFIDQILQKMGVRDCVDKICATELIYDEAGKVTGHRKGTFIGTTEKGIATEQMMSEWRVSPQRTVGIGDSEGDRHIAPEHRLLLIFDESQIGQNQQYFTETIVSPDWSDVQSWLSAKFSL